MRVSFDAVRTSIRHVATADNARKAASTIGNLSVEVGSGMAAEVGDIGRSIRTATELRHVGGTDDLRKIAVQGVRELRTGKGLKRAAAGDIGGVIADIRAGRPGRAAGRGVVKAATSFIPGGRVVRTGISAARRGAELAEAAAREAGKAT